jgi:hypothetical protein
MRFSFFRDRLCIESVRFSVFNPNLGGQGYVNPTKSAQNTQPDNVALVGSESKEAPKFNAAELKEKLGITEAAAKLLTNGGKETLTEKQVLEKLQSSKIYDISRKADAKPDSFESFNNTTLLSKIDKLDGESGNISIEKGNLVWGAVGATPLMPADNSTRTVSATNPTNIFSSSTRREAGFAGPEFNPPSTETVKEDSAKIETAIKATGGTPNQKIEYQGVLLTGSGNQGSDNVRLYSVGEGENSKYVGVKQGNAQILSEKELEAHLAELNKTRTAENKTELDTGIIADILNKSGRYLNVPPKTEA